MGKTTPRKRTKEKVNFLPFPRNRAASKKIEGRTMNEPSTHHITHLLERIGQGDSKAQQALFESLYSELRSLAEAKLRGEQPDCLLQPTMLVHEAYLRIFGEPAKVESFENRRHFFAAMARAMQQVLVDYARRRLAQKRQAHQHPAAAEPAPTQEPAVDAHCEEILQVEECLKRLEEEEPLAARVVQMRFFAGYTMAETAQTLGVSLRTAQRLWNFAQARLRQWIKNAS
jgi:RNA polymerase sigma factor (TIGR02999 family)